MTHRRPGAPGRQRPARSQDSVLAVPLRLTARLTPPALSLRVLKNH